MTLADSMLLHLGLLRLQRILASPGAAEDIRDGLALTILQARLHRAGYRVISIERIRG